MIKKLMPALLGAALGAAVALGGNALIPSLGMGGLEGLGPVGTAFFVAALIATVFTVLALHELGHVVAGLLFGFEFRSLVVGPLRIERAHGRLTVRLNRSISLAGGIAVMVPVGTDQLRSRMAGMTAGGPMASLLLGGLLVLAVAFPTPATEMGVVSGLLGLAGLVSLAIALVTLIPGKTGGFITDGARLLVLLRGGAEAEREVALLALLAASRAGVPGRGLDPCLIDRLRNGPLNVNSVVGDIMAYERHLDRGELELAGAAIRRAVANAHLYPDAAAPSIHLEAAYFAAAHGNDPVSARRILDGTGKGALVSPETPLRARAAVLLAEGRLQEARAVIGEALDVIGDDSDPDAATARRRLEGLRARAEAGVPA